MGGFFKGVVIGVASFAAGFAVLSVVLPPPAPNPDDVAPVTQAAGEPAPPGEVGVAAAPLFEATEASTQATAPVAAPLAVIAPEPPAQAPAAPEAAPAPEVAPVSDPTRAPAPDPVAVIAPEPPAPAPAAPEAAPAPTRAPAPEPVAVIEPEPLTPAPAAPEAAAESPRAPAPDPVAGIAPQPPAPAPAAPEAAPAPPPAPATDGAVQVSEPHPAVPPEPPASAPANTGAVNTPALASVEPSPDPTPAGAAPSVAPLARPPMPVPATILPVGEPLVMPSPESDTPAEAPRDATIVAMPGGSDVATVRRGGEAVGALPPAVAGVTIRRPGVDPAPGPATTETEADLSQPALRLHAASFTPPDGARLLGLVLIDAAAAEAALVALPFAVTIALDPGDPAAPARARAYRAAGHEVALLAQGFPRLAGASDVLVTLNAWTALFPEAVAILDVPVNGLGAQRALARDVAAMLAPAGLGAIALRDGGDALMAAARAEGVPALALYRLIDAGSDIALRRMIDRAAFEAGRRDGVLIAAPAADPAVLAALIAQSAEGRAGVVLAPASALLVPP